MASDLARPDLARRVQRFAVFGAGLLALTVLDQWSKSAAVQRLGAPAGRLPTDGDLLTSAPHAVIGEWFSLRLAGNKGVANSMFADLPEGWRVPILVGFALVALGVVIVLFARSTARLDAIALTCIAGGAVGNLVDRIQLGYVVDFISWRLGGWTIPTFNVADVAICVGVGLLFVAGFRQRGALLAASG